jgi:hypothetical protein
MKYYVDPPSGWKYGFPMVFDSSTGESLRDFYLRNGYPEKDVDFAIKYTRSWDYEEKQ